MSWIRSPLLHFLAIGVVLFAVGEARDARQAIADPAASRIEIDAARVESLEQDFVTQMGRRPGAEEREGLLASEIEEEILYREALARGLLERDGGVQTRLIQKMLFLEGATEIEDAGALLEKARSLELDRDDLVVRRILIQKMKLYASILDQDELPSAEDVAERYAQTRDSLREPDRIDFVQVFLSADARGDATLEEARALRSKLAAASIDLDAAIRSGDPFPLGHRFARRSERDLARSFGGTLGPEALAAEVGQWSAPIASAYGQHLLFIEAREAGEIPPLEAVTDRIRRILERERQDQKLEALLSDLKKRYEVVVADVAKDSA